MEKIRTWIRENRQEFTRFIKFCVVGTVGTVIDFGLFSLLHLALGWPQVVSNLLSTSAAVINNYTWSRYWVYPETKNQQGTKKFIQFVIVSIVAVVLNTAILKGSDSLLLGPKGLLGFLIAPLAGWTGMAHSDFSSLAAKVIATGIVLFWNFFANRLWTFNDVNQAQAEDDAGMASAAQVQG